MIDAQTYSRLQDIIRREGRSLLQYAIDSFPWAGSQTAAANACLQEMAQEEAEAIGQLGRLLLRHRLTPPYLGPYPMAFTSYNFLALGRLLPLLVRHQRADIDRLEADLKQVSDPEVRGPLQHLLDVKRRHLAELEALEPMGKPALKS
ncbi:MAG: hypothetical protein IT429_15070 [Gemmataceae bacterium]|nr:hypothetical protein [Gemmataceae bacterium]